MMHTFVILDPETCVYDAHMYDAQMYDAHMYDAVLFGDQRTDEQGDSRSWI